MLLKASEQQEQQQQQQQEPQNKRLKSAQNLSSWVGSRMTPTTTTKSIIIIIILIFVDQLRSIPWFSFSFSISRRPSPYSPFVFIMVDDGHIVHDREHEKKKKVSYSDKRLLYSLIGYNFMW